MPRAFQIDRAVHLASSVLPAAGAFTNQTPIDLPIGAKYIVFWITYTRGAGGGYPIFAVEWSNGTETAEELVQYDPNAVVINDTVQVPLYRERPALPPPTDGNPVTFALPVRVEEWGAITLRLKAAEKGSVGSPGTIAIAYTGSRGGDPA